MEHWPLHAAECTHLAAKNAARDAAAAAAAGAEQERRKKRARPERPPQRAESARTRAARVKTETPESPMSPTAPISPFSKFGPRQEAAVGGEGGSAPPAPPVVFVNGIAQSKSAEEGFVRVRRPPVNSAPIARHQQQQRQQQSGSMGQFHRAADPGVHTPISLSDVERVDWSQKLVARVQVLRCDPSKVSTDPQE